MFFLGTLSLFGDTFSETSELTGAYFGFFFALNSIFSAILDANLSDFSS